VPERIGERGALLRRDAAALTPPLDFPERSTPSLSIARRRDEAMEWTITLTVRKRKAVDELPVARELFLDVKVLI
jgi:hypothetical protein